MDAFLGSIMLFAGNFAPRGWAFCQGQIMAISQNTAVFSLLGTTYGGNGQTTFALPDLRGRAPIGQGQGPGLPNVVLGESSGTEQTTLQVNNMPKHSHALASGGGANAYGPSGNLCAEESNQSTQVYASGAPTGQMSAQAIGAAGENQPFSIMQPYLGLNYIICLEGIFPSRN
jgi:microcystin-dependent protein